MLNIAITAGGTSENIDGVRTLTNVSTGRLGWACLKAVLDYFRKKEETAFRLYYIFTQTAYREELDETHKNVVDFIPVSDAQSVYEAVDRLTSRVFLSHFIHSMAVSDFTFSYAVTPSKLAGEIHSFIASNGSFTPNDIERILSFPQSRYPEDRKISSDESLILGLKTTGKVISLVKKNNPQTFLVGFKLLRNANENECMKEAKKLTHKNQCDLVFANELGEISEGNHCGILVKGGEIIARLAGKDRIAQGLVEKMMESSISLPLESSCL